MSNAASALWASIVRTIVPIVVGAVVSWAVSLGITVDDQFEPLLTAFLTLVFSGIYYAAVRVLETYVTPKLGWLLGLAKTPAVYTTESPVDPNADRAAVAALAAPNKQVG